MRVAVIGVGYVGLVAGACLADVGNHVIGVDHDESKINALKKGEIPIYEPGLAEIVKHNETGGRLRFTTNLAEAVKESQIIILAVGTPSAADGSADISAILKSAGDVAERMDGYRIIITKSTVPVGTHHKVTELMRQKTDQPFDYVSNPEFLKEGAAVDDFLKPDRVIIGTTNPAVTEIMKQLYAPFMRKSNRMIFMDPASAELTKYAANAMLATRISFMNELAGLCERFGGDVEKVRAGVGSDGRIGNAFLFPGVGYGGSCFPKDIRALIHMGRELSCPMTIAQAVEQANLTQQQRFARRIIDELKQRKGRAVAIWGLAFKARTDDVRESPALYVAEQLLNAGLKVRAYDPEAMNHPDIQQGPLGKRMELRRDAYSVLEGNDALVILTDWQEFRTPDFELMRRKLNSPLIFDGRNLYDGHFAAQQGIEYHSIGRPTAYPQTTPPGKTS